MRLSHLAVVGTLAAGLVGCRDDSADAITPTIPPVAYVRYINAVPDTLNTLVRWIDQLDYVPQTFANVPYRGLGQGNYQGVDVRAKRIRIFTTDISTYSAATNTVVLVDTSITFEAGKYYTMLHTGFARAGATPKQGLKIIEDVFPTVGSNVAVRYMNAGNGLGTLDLYTPAAVVAAGGAVTGTAAVTGLAAGALSPYTIRTPGAFAATATATGTTTSLFSTLAPAGVAGNPFAPAANGIAAIAAVDPISGSTVAGSVMTAIAFPATPANKPGPAATVFAAPAVVYFLDKQPPRFSTP